MAEHYTLEVLRDKDGNETVDLQKLSFILKRIQDLLTNLDASQKTVFVTGTLDMGGNAVKNGPATQETAEDSDYIVRSYFDSDEFADRIRQIIREAGSP